MMTDNPYTPPVTDGQERESRFVLVVGFVSAVTFAYVTIIHVLFLSFAASGRIQSLDVVVSYPVITATHIAVCLVGGTTAVYLLVHALRNRRIRLGRRFLWGMVIAIGYGMPFYWYRHVRSKTLE